MNKICKGDEDILSNLIPGHVLAERQTEEDAAKPDEGRAGGIINKRCRLIIMPLVYPANCISKTRASGEVVTGAKSARGKEIKCSFKDFL